MDLLDPVDYTWVEPADLEAVAADGLVARPGVKAVMEGGGSRHQQAAHFGAVALKHAHTLASL